MRCNTYRLLRLLFPVLKCWDDQRHRNCRANLIPGYPGSASVRAGWHRNPADVLLLLLSQEVLESRVAEALPWVLLHHTDMDRGYLVREARLRNLSNRLGFAVSLALRVAERRSEQGSKAYQVLVVFQDELRKSRLASEDTFGHPMPEAEREWVQTAHPMPSIGMYSQTGSRNISSTPMPDQLVVLPPPWDKFLREVDAQLPEEVHLVCIGGFVLAALYGFPRPTDDLDYVSNIPKQASELIEEIAGKNSALAPTRQSLHPFRGRCVDIPEEYEDRLLPILLAYERLQIAVPDPYDLVLSKLTRNSPKDREDVKHVAIKSQLSFATIMERFENEMDWIANAERHRTTLNLWRQLGCWTHEQHA